MSVKSIIEVDVQAEAFTEFQRLFQKYQAALKGMPGDWAKVSAAQTAAGTAGRKSFTEGAVAATAIGTELNKAVKSTNALTQASRNSNTTFKDLARTTGTIASNVASTTFQLLKWAALGGIVGAATGFFGAGAISGSASNLRRESQGYGTTPGRLRAARLNYGNYVDANAVLGNLSNMQSNPAEWGHLAAMGISRTGDPADQMGALLQNAIKAFKRGGAMGLSAAGFDQAGVTAGDARRLSGLPAGELQGAIGQYGADARSTAVGDANLRSLQLLQNQFSRAGDQIENVFIKLLSRVAPNLGHFSDSIARALDSFARNPNVGHWIDEFGDGIERASKYLVSDDFQTDIKSFMGALATAAQDLKDLAGYAHAIAHPWDSLSPDAATANKGARELAAGHPFKAAWDMPTFGQGGFLDALSGYSLYQSPRHNPGNLRSSGGMPTSGGFAEFPDEQSGFRAMGRQLQLYGGRGINTLDSIISKYAPSSENNVGAYVGDVAHQMGVKSDQKLDLGNVDTLSALVAAMAKHENRYSNVTPTMVRSMITINDQTGGAVNVITNQLAH